MRDESLIDELNERHGLDGIRFDSGQGGLPKAVLTSRHGTAEIYLHGGHVTHYQPSDGEPVLWMSDEAVFDGNKAIRGGIPVVFPWFGPHQTDKGQPQHGFARNATWKVDSTASGDELAIVLSLASTLATKRIWPHDFKLKLSTTLAQSLEVSLTIQNTGDKHFEVSPALHTYFVVGDIRKTSITGFEDAHFVDQLADEQRQQRGSITFGEEVDRIYFAGAKPGNPVRPAVIMDDTLGRRIEISSEGSQSSVVWNPWIDKSKRMSDFPDDGYLTMVCVETANAADDSRMIEPGKTHTMTQSIHVVSQDAQKG